MKFISLAVLLPALFMTSAVSGQCTGECVAFFSGTDCQDEILEFPPSCNTNCIQLGFNSIFTFGSLIHGTDCHAYSDSGCQNEIVDTGNHIPGRCTNAQGANSYKCFFDC
ncbi:hypothetical protein C8R46DRAFT_879099 [Mycena filopes]|nr:hypothetical protein C8R46DRAFT_879099 [Mycena filopes]